jgi:ATP-dependent Clp protease protease subunit
MPIGVPRIIYCWGEELPAQWTDIYNFIFRRRMVFLMQYLDDELCNQICGLLINIHMEDRTKELEKKEMERSGLFKTSGGDAAAGSKSAGGANSPQSFLDGSKGMKTSSAGSKKSMDDLLLADEDLGIQDIDTLEQYTLQKITMEWLNWNAQFFDYSEEPYLFYLAEMLSPKGDSANPNAQNLYNQRNFSGQLKNLMPMFKKNNSLDKMQGNSEQYRHLDLYSPFRQFANFASEDYSLKDLNPIFKNPRLLEVFWGAAQGINSKSGYKAEQMLSNLSLENFKAKMKNPSNIEQTSERSLGQRQLRKQFLQESINKRSTNGLNSFDFNQMNSNYSGKFANYLDTSASGLGQAENFDAAQFKEYYRKQTENTLKEEESKKVFMIINSFGGSVGNGITVHDALQFIKAGSLTLGLGVAASAASLALAGGTIGERYVTEGCHTMIHQPEGGLQGQASDIWIDSQEIMKIRLDVAEIYSLSTYRPKHKILRDLDRDFYLTATETIYYGLADEIATNEVLNSIIELTSKVWDYDDSKQQRLLETRESASAGLDTQTQN